MNVVAHNLTAMNASRQFGITNKQQAKVTEKLSSGLKINRAADDAAGLSISEKMRRQIRGLNQSCQNIQEGIGYAQVADGALNEVHDILQRINELAVKSANGTMSDDDRTYIDSEVQQLKTEMERIFDTTKFNETKIWEPNGARKQIGTEMKPAVTSRTLADYNMDITNENCHVLSCNGYKTIADDNGIHFEWTGYDGNSYVTNTMDWATLESKNYTFDMNELFTADMLDSNGNPPFSKVISLDVAETATIDDLKYCLNNRIMSSSTYALVEAGFEDEDGNKLTKDVEMNSYGLNYGAIYASHASHGTGVGDCTTNLDGKDFDAADDEFIEPLIPNGTTTNLIVCPNSSTVDDAKTDNMGWTFAFNLEGVGEVHATATEIKYTCKDRDDNSLGTWWKWERVMINGVEGYEQREIPHYADPTLSGLMSTLTGASGTNTPGLLTQDGGISEYGGYIFINFDMNVASSDDAFDYGTTTDETRVGTFSLRIRVEQGDDQESILNKVTSALNDTTILDIGTRNATSDYLDIYSLGINNRDIEVPIWGGACEFQVHGGVEAGEKIRITYDALSLMELGIHETNVLTEEDALAAIDEIDNALKEISTQRSLFGAYQNRLEHAYNNNRNVEENTTASESQIRDTDMASMMVKYSNNNILLQAGQAMMAQANQSNQGVLSLLR